MTPANLMGVKDAYYMAQPLSRTPSPSSIVCPRTVGHGIPGSSSRPASHGSARRRRRDAARARLLQAFPDVSAERMLNEDYAFARKEDEDFFVDSFRRRGPAGVHDGGGDCAVSGSKATSRVSGRARQGGGGEILISSAPFPSHNVRCKSASEEWRGKAGLPASLAHVFSSRLSSFRKRQSVPWAMISCGVDLIMPTSCSRSA